MLQLDPADIERHKKDWIEAEARAVIAEFQSAGWAKQQRPKEVSLPGKETQLGGFTRADFIEALEKSARPFDEEKSET